MSHRLIHLLIADDHPLIRSGLRAQIEPLGGAARFVISEAADAATLRQRLVHSAAMGQGVELALVDVMMPGMQGGVTLLELAQSHPQVAFLLITGLPSSQVVQLAASLRGQSNVRGILGKSHGAGELRRAIDLALAGIPIWPEMDSAAAQWSQAKDTRSVGADLAITSDSLNDENHSEFDPLQGLSPRQRAVALAVARGLSNAQIAVELCLTEGTVKAYLKDIFRQIGASNRTQLALRIGTVNSQNEKNSQVE